MWTIIDCFFVSDLFPGMRKRGKFVFSTVKLLFLNILSIEFFGFEAMIF